MDRAELFAALLCAALALGCETGEILQPDAAVEDGDSGTPGDPDARESDVSAIELEFRTDPEVPADLGGPWDATVSRVRIRVEDLRVVGDAAILEDQELELEFTARQHIKHMFAPAAPGMYSTFIGRIERYEIEGTVDIGDGDEDFEIDDEPPPSTTFVVLLGDSSLAEGETKRIRIDIEIDELINDMDWSKAEVDDDELVPSDSMKEELREGIAEAFGLH